MTWLFIGIVIGADIVYAVHIVSWHAGWRKGYDDCWENSSEGNLG